MSRHTVLHPTTADRSGSLATLLTQSRLNLRLTQAEVANAIGIYPGGYGEIERGARSLAPHRAVALATILQINLDVLIQLADIDPADVAIDHEADFKSAVRKLDPTEMFGRPDTTITRCTRAHPRWFSAQYWDAIDAELADLIADVAA